MQDEQERPSGEVHVERSAKKKRAKRSRGWCFTLNNYFPSDVLRLRKIGRSDDSVYLIFGREYGELRRTRHLQGYLYLKNPKAFRGVVKLMDNVRFHLEAARGSPDANRKYCSKDGDFEEYGQCPQRGRRTDLEGIREAIEQGASDREIATNNFSRWVLHRRSFAAYRQLLQRQNVVHTDRRVYLLIGPAGIGKTRFVWERSGGAVWLSSDPQLKWFDGYDGQEHALIDDFRGGAEFAFLLRVLDIYPLDVPVKGSYVAWIPRVIWITSNTHPESWYPNDDLEPLRRRFSGVVTWNGGPPESFQEYKERVIQSLGLHVSA